MDILEDVSGLSPAELLALRAKLHADGSRSDAVGVVIEDESQGVVEIPAEAAGNAAEAIAGLLMAVGGNVAKLEPKHRRAARVHKKMLNAQMRAMRADPTMDIQYADGRTQRYHLPPLRWNSVARAHEFVQLDRRPRLRAPRARGYRTVRRAVRHRAHAPPRRSEDPEPPPLTRLALALLVYLRGAR